MQPMLLLLDFLKSILPKVSPKSQVIINLIFYIRAVRFSGLIDFSRSHIGNRSTGFNGSAFMNPEVLWSCI